MPQHPLLFCGPPNLAACEDLASSGQSSNLTPSDPLPHKNMGPVLPDFGHKEPQLQASMSIFSRFHKPNDMPTAELSPVVLLQPVGQMVALPEALDHPKRSDVN